MKKNNVKIAVTYDNGLIFQHFGQTAAFRLYEVENGKILDARTVSTGGKGHGALAGVLRELGAEALVCGGIGDGARQALAQAGIRLYAGVSGAADRAVEDLLTGRLSYGTEANCDHHGEHHGDHQGGCGEHGCGGHENC